MTALVTNAYATISPISFSSGSFTPNFTGPFAVGQDVIILYRQLDKLITLEIAAISAAPAASSVATSGAAAIPLALRPTATINGMVSIRANAVVPNQPGRCELLADGTINIYADIVGTGLFSAIGNNGWLRFSLSYCI